MPSGMWLELVQRRLREFEQGGQLHNYNHGAIVFDAQGTCCRQPDTDWWTAGLIHVTRILRRDPTDPANL